jgi:hypothetical protein
MIVYVDIVSRKIVSSLKLNKEVERIEVKRGDILPLSLVFVQDGASVALPTGILIAFCAKLRNNFTGPAIVLTQTFVKNESSMISYDGVVRFDGELLTEHMDQTASQDDDLSLVDLLLEITWTDTTAQTTETSNTIDLRVVNDVYKGNENMPIPPDDEPFVFPFGIQTNTIDPVSGGVVTIGGTLAAAHIHGNLAGNVYTHVRAGEALAKGDPVYVSGSHGSGSTLIPIVSKADAANAAKMPAIGIVDTDLANNANGHMVIVGAITEFNTAAYPVNAELYVANGGGLTATPPAASSQAVGRVERSNANNGAFIVKVNGWASSGGNGAADARKLVRFGVDGTIPASSVGGLSPLATTQPGTGVVSALSKNIGTVGSMVANGGALGAPQSGDLVNCTIGINAPTDEQSPGIFGNIAMNENYVFFRTNTQWKRLPLQAFTVKALLFNGRLVRYNGNNVNCTTA